jgi:transposase-like protein
MVDARERNMRGRRTDDTVRAQIVAGLLTGAPVVEVAAQHNVSEQTVRNLQKAPEFREVWAEKENQRPNIPDLVEGYLAVLFASLTAQAQLVSTPEYLLRQPAGEVAILHGVMADKTFRLLAALTIAVQQQPAGYDGGEG